MEFWKNFLKYCNKIGKSPNAIAKELGIASGSVTAWKNGTIPHATTLNKIADYFSISVACLLGYENEKEKNSANTEFSEKDIMLVEAYHKSEPVIQSTVDKLLGIEEKTYTVKIAARDGSFQERVLTETEWKKLQDLPDADL